MTTGERLKTLRKEYLKITASKLAESLNVTKATISTIENNKSQLTVRMANEICDKYHVDYLWLMEGKDVPVFLEGKEDDLDELTEKYQLTPAEREMMKYWLDHPELRSAIENAIRDLKDGMV